MLKTKANSTTYNLLEMSDVFDIIYPIGSVYWANQILNVHYQNMVEHGN